MTNIRRRHGLEEPEPFGAALAAITHKTLGVPLFQEQAMKIAQVAAGYTAEEADKLRRSLASFRRMGTIGAHRDRFTNGMLEHGYSPDIAAQCFTQIAGFADYGSPESHAADFALLTYVSAWLKCHYPAVFTCALLNSQPVGFYDRDGAGLNVGNRRLGRSCRLGELFLREVACLAARAQSGTCLPQAADAGWGQTAHADVYSSCAI